MRNIFVTPTLDDYTRLLPDNSHKFKHRIVVKRDLADLTKVLTAFPVIHNETKELIAFVDLKWEKDDYNRETP